MDLPRRSWGCPQQLRLRVVQIADHIVEIYDSHTTAIVVESAAAMGMTVGVDCAVGLVEYVILVNCYSGHGTVSVLYLWAARKQFPSKFIISTI
jgi:hypothetical protein